MSGLMKTLMENNKAPGWFYLDKQKGLSDEEIMAKIRVELYNEVFNRGYNMKLWTEAFIAKVSGLYFDHFNKLYEMGGGAAGSEPISTNMASI